jgi:hypothetical protein
MMVKLELKETRLEILIARCERFSTALVGDRFRIIADGDVSINYGPIEDTPRDHQAVYDGSVNVAKASPYPQPTPQEPQEINDVPSRATQKALDQALDITAQQLLPEMGFQLMAPAEHKLSDSIEGHEAIWLRKDSGYLFVGSATLLRMVNSPKRRCLDCGRTREDHDDSECEFVLSPIYESNPAVLKLHQQECWRIVRRYQLRMAGYRVLPERNAWASEHGRMMSEEGAWAQLKIDASAKYMRECVHCKRQPEVHPEMMCPYNRGTVYLSRLQVMMTEDQPHLHELLVERDKPLSQQERQS